jgi:hypothetical protein
MVQITKFSMNILNTAVLASRCVFLYKNIVSIKYSFLFMFGYEEKISNCLILGIFHDICEFEVETEIFVINSNFGCPFVFNYYYFRIINNVYTYLFTELRFRQLFPF